MNANANTSKTRTAENPYAFRLCDKIDGQEFDILEVHLNGNILTKCVTLGQGNWRGEYTILASEYADYTVSLYCDGKYERRPRYER